MKSRTGLKWLLLTLGALMLSAYQAASVYAQCAMCRASVQAGANASVNPQDLANTLNLAVLVLLIPPVLIFSALFIVLLRYRREMDGRGAGRLGAAGALD